MLGRYVSAGVLWDCVPYPGFTLRANLYRPSVTKKSLPNSRITSTVLAGLKGTYAKEFSGRERNIIDCGDKKETTYKRRNKDKEEKMQELIEKIMSEIEDNLILPGYSDKELRDITAFVLTVAFSYIGEVCAGLVSQKVEDHR